MSDFADFFLDQAEASAHVQFVYDLAAGRVVSVNAAYERVFQGRRELVIIIFQPYIRQPTQRTPLFCWHSNGGYVGMDIAVVRKMCSGHVSIGESSRGHRRPR